MHIHILGIGGTFLGGLDVRRFELREPTLHDAFIGLTGDDPDQDQTVRRPMNRTLLIARREYAAYARTVGFWLSLLAFPIFGVLGGALPLMMRGADPVRAVVLIEEGPTATGLAAAVKNVLDADAERQAERAREAAEKAAKSSGAPPGAAESAIASMTRSRMRFVDAPADLSAA
eukprot:gene45515-60820_t